MITQCRKNVTVIYIELLEGIFFAESTRNRAYTIYTYSQTYANYPALI